MKRQPAEVVSEYLELVKAHRLEDAMAYLDEAFQLEFEGSAFSMSKAQARRAMEWDLGTNGLLEWTLDGEDGQIVRVVGHESNDFLQLAGIGRLPFRSLFEVVDGVIVRHMHDTDWGGKSVEEALAPAVAWAASHEPDELAEIYPEGHLQYTREGGERWVALLRRWRTTTAETGGA